MTEPLLLGLTTLAVALLDGWSSLGAERAARCVAGWAFALACLTRYEAWPVTVARARGRGVGALARAATPPPTPAARVGGDRRLPRRRGRRLPDLQPRRRRPAGSWTAASSCPENKALGRPMLAAAEIGWGTRDAERRRGRSRSPRSASRRSSSRGLVVRRRADALVAARARRDGRAAVGGVRRRAIRSASATWCRSSPSRRSAPASRRRCPSRPAPPAGGGGAAERARRHARAVAAYELRPLERAGADGRRGAVGSPEPAGARSASPTASRRGYRGEKIMASMGSLGHYMQEAARRRLRDPRFPARGQRRHLARGARRPAAVRRLGAHRGEGVGRRHAREDRAREPALPRRVLARLRRRGAGALPARSASEADSEDRAGS